VFVLVRLCGAYVADHFNVRTSTPAPMLRRRARVLRADDCAQESLGAARGCGLLVRARVLRAMRCQRAIRMRANVSADTRH